MRIVCNGGVHVPLIYGCAAPVRAEWTNLEPGKHASDVRIRTREMWLFRKSWGFRSTYASELGSPSPCHMAEDFFNAGTVRISWSENGQV